MFDPLGPEKTRSSQLACRLSARSRIAGYGLQFGTLRASWGDGSIHDGERYEIHLCEPCFFRTLLGLRRERMVNFMFSDEDQDLSDFGRVARNDGFNKDGNLAT